MSKESLLIKNTIIVTMGKICTQLISFFLLPLYTALLTTDEYGVVDLLNTIISLLVPIIVLQLDQGVFRYLIDCRGKDDEQNKLITSTAYFVLAQICIYCLLFFVFSPFLHNEYKYFLLYNLIASLLVTVLMQISRGMGDNFTYSIGSFIAGSLAIILNVLFIVQFNMGANGMLLASLISNAVCALYFFSKLGIFKRINKKLYDFDILKDMLHYSIPLVPNTVSWWIVSASNRVIISFFLNLSANGIFSAANKFSGIITTIYGIFNLTWTESASLNIHSTDRDKFFSKIFDSVLRIFGSICLNVFTLMPIVFPIMLNENYIDAYDQIPILMIATLFNIFVSFYGSIYVANKLTKEIAKTSIMSAVINLSFNCIFIHFLGLFAASLATAISYLLIFIYRYFDSKKYVCLKINKKISLSMVTIYIISLALYYIDNNFLNTFMIGIGLIYALFVNVKFVKSILTIIKKILKQKILLNSRRA